MFSYRAVLGQAWTTTKHHKKLWLFGLLTFLLTAGGEYQILNKIINNDYGTGIFTSSSVKSIFLDSSFWKSLWQVCTTDPRSGLIVILMILLLAFVAFIFLWVSIRSQIALIKWTDNYRSAKNKEKKASFWEEIFTRNRKFWPVLWLNLLVYLAVWALFFFLSLPLFFLYVTDSSWSIVIYTVFFVIFLPLALSISLLIKYAIASVVLEKQSFVKALETGRHLFAKNWLVSLEMAILLFLINFLVSLICLFFLSIILLPVMLTLIIFNLPIPLYFLIIITFVFLALVAAILMAFQTAAWTLLYRELQGAGATAKLERIFSKKTKKIRKKKTSK
jgi:hypothetical protein